MSPLRDERGLIKFYEILPEGIEELEKAQTETSTRESKEAKPQGKILGITTELIREIKDLHEISDEKKQNLISKLNQIKENLEKFSL